MQGNIYVDFAQHAKECIDFAQHAREYIDFAQHARECIDFAQHAREYRIYRFCTAGSQKHWGFGSQIGYLTGRLGI